MTGAATSLKVSQVRIIACTGKVIIGKKGKPFRASIQVTEALALNASDLSQASIDENLATGHETAVRGRQERSHRRRLCRIPHAPERRRGPKRIHPLLAHHLDRQLGFGRPQ